MRVRIFMRRRIFYIKEYLFCACLIHKAVVASIILKMLP